MLKNFLKLAGIAAWAFGSIGGFGFLLACHKPVCTVCALCVAFVAVLSFPSVRGWFKKNK